MQDKPAYEPVNPDFDKLIMSHFPRRMFELSADGPLSHTELRKPVVRRPACLRFRGRDRGGDLAPLFDKVPTGM